MPPATLRPYHIACRNGHRNTTHQHGFCIHTGCEEIVWYQYEDDGHRQVCYHALPSLMRCAECNSYTESDDDYLCKKCRTKED